MGSGRRATVVSDECLVKKVISGDSQAFAELRQRYYSFVVDFTKSIMKSNDVDDLVQDVWLRVFKKAHQWEGRASFRTWLGTIVINTCRMDFSLRNRMKRKESLTISLDVDFIQKEFNNNLARADSSLEAVPVMLTINKIREELKRQRPVSERAFSLMLEGYSVREIANMLNKSEAAVKQNIRKARKFMRKHYYGGNQDGDNI